MVAQNKTGEACASPAVGRLELRSRWSAEPLGPFQLQLAPHAFCTSVASREPYRPPFFIDAHRVYLKGPRLPIEPPPWYDRFARQNPVGVTRPVPPERWPFLPPSRSSGGSAFRSVRFPFCPGPETGPVLPAAPAFRPAGFNQRGAKSTASANSCQRSLSTDYPQKLNRHFTCKTQVDEIRENRSQKKFLNFAMKRT